MADPFTIVSRQQFNTNLWTRAQKLRHWNYKQHPPGKEPKRGVPLEPGQPAGINTDRLCYHTNWARLWKEWVEEKAATEGRPPNYSLIYDPPAEGSGQVERSNGAKILAFHQSLLDWYEDHSGKQRGVNSQVHKGMTAFFRDLLIAQFHEEGEGRSKRMQEYSVLSAPDIAVINAHQREGQGARRQGGFLLRDNWSSALRGRRAQVLQPDQGEARLRHVQVGGHHLHQSHLGPHVLRRQQGKAAD